MARGNVAEFTVSELSGAIKRTMEETFGYVRLRGEISGYRGPHSSGHAYFALKDDRAKIEAVVWKGVFGGLAFKPEEGLEVIATGKVSTFPGTSKYQIVIERLEPAGAGALMALLEERKKKLAAEGLFDAGRKRPLPFLPQLVGVITSPTGAVIRDMLHGFNERFPMHVILWPVRCQGETCAAEVSAAIRGFNTYTPRPDVLIVARGGGAIEDLWGYNEEIVVRAVAASGIPVISAVGHETDWTLIDLVADARAPTPTKAAEWAAPKYAELLAKSADISARLNAGVFRQLEAKRNALRSAGRGLPRLQDLISLPRQRFDASAGRLERSLAAYAAAARARAQTAFIRLNPHVLRAAFTRRRDALQAHEQLLRSRLDKSLAARRARHGVLAARLRPSTLAMRLERAGERLAAQSRAALQAFGRVAERRRVLLRRNGDRLRPTMLSAPTERGRERLGLLEARSERGLRAVLVRRRERLTATAQLLNSLSYKNVLERGFAVVRDEAGAMVRRAAAAPSASALEIEFADGRLPVHTAPRNPAEPARPALSADGKAKKRAQPKQDQGRLL
ncbi:MAG: exodeoxyribonuclease VII large subunit [Hyphomicrobiales bacterium]|nr:exodeoxyribonuclease VII large subunit [Hyphomicrobiales bacterium]